MPIPASRIRGANSSFYEGANFLITDQECQFPRGCQFPHHGSGVPISYPMRISILASWIRECQFSIPSLPISSTDESVPIPASRIRVCQFLIPRLCQFSDFHHESRMCQFLYSDFVNSLITYQIVSIPSSRIKACQFPLSNLSIPSSGTRVCQFPHHGSDCINSLITDQVVSIPSSRMNWIP